MDVDDHPLAGRLRELGDRLVIAPDHIGALLVLASCACAGLLVLWWTARPIPSSTSAASMPPIAAPSVLAPSERTSDAPVAGGAPGPTAQPRTPPVVVHVSGAVVAAGVVELPAGSRVVDAVDAAGGLRRRAQTGRLNLARVVRDGEQIHVPGPGDAAHAPAAGAASLGAAPNGAAPGATGSSVAGPSGAMPGASGAGAPIDLNAASAAELEALPGVGPVLAGRIVAHREAIGGFTSVDQLLEVTGIGEKTLAALRDLVVV